MAEETATNHGPFWIGYKLRRATAEEINLQVSRRVARAADADDLHTTLYYSKSNPDAKEWPEPNFIYTKVTISGLALLGGTSLVLLIEPSAALKSRFEDLKAKYPTDFPNWIPHITIAYDSNIDELKQMQPWLEKHIGSDISLDGEVIELIGDPSEKKDDENEGDEASLSPSVLSDIATTTRDAFFDTARKSEVERMRGRSGMLRSFNTHLSKVQAMLKAWDGKDFIAFREAAISICDAVKGDWDIKNELEEKEKQKASKKKGKV